MKKIIAAAAVLAAIITLPSLASAQGTIVFNNNSNGLVKQWSFFDGTLMTVPSGGGYVQLAYAPSGTALSPWNVQTTGAWLASNPGWTLGPITAIFPAPGRFNGGAVTLAGISAGANADYVLFGWTGPAKTFDEALITSLDIGVSSRFTTATGGAGTPPSVPVQLGTSFTGMTVYYIPEPSSLTLIGLAGLLVFRKRHW